MPSIHGICFDEGQVGHCGFECRGFLEGECDIPDEILSHADDELIREIMIHCFGSLRFAVLTHQTKYRFDIKEEFEKMISDGTAAEYFGY